MTQALTMRSPRRPGWGQTVRFILLLTSVVLVLIPVYVLLVTSFKGSADADPSRTWYLPEVWVTKNWSNAWNQLSGGLLRSLALVIPSSIISAMLGSANGFVLSKWRFPGANVVFTLILFGMFIPYQAVMIPLMRLVTSADLGFGIHTLILMHVVYGIPITTLIFRNYYETIPNELIEAARVDGAGMLRTYVSVVLPISVPSFVVVLIWQFTSAWNDFLFALFFGGGAQSGPVTLALNNLAHGSILADYGASLSGALNASVPTLAVYILLGKYFVGGLMAGSGKGGVRSGLPLSRGPADPRHRIRLPAPAGGREPDVMRSGYGTPQIQAPLRAGAHPLEHGPSRLRAAHPDRSRRGRLHRALPARRGQALHLPRLPPRHPGRHRARGGLEQRVPLRGGPGP